MLSSPVGATYKIFLPEISDHLTSNPSLAKTEPGIPIGNLDTPPELSNNKSPLVVNTAAVSPWARIVQTVASEPGWTFVCWSFNCTYEFEEYLTTSPILYAVAAS